MTQRNNDESKFNRRTVIKSTTGATTLGMLAGCLGNGDAGDGADPGNGDAGDDADPSDAADEELIVLNKETIEESVAWWDEVGDGFEGETGTELVVDHAGLDLVPVATSMIQTGNPPDLATLALDQVGPFLDQGQLANVDPIVDILEEEIGEILDSEKLMVDGTNYLVPLWTNPTQLWYWEDVYEEYGFDTTPGINWDELEEIAQTLYEGDMVDYGFTVSLGGARRTGYLYWNFLASNGGQLCHVDDGEIDIAIDSGENRERAIETLDYLNELYQYSPAATDYQWGEDLEAYMARTSGHSLYGPRAKLSVIENRPDLKDLARPHFPVSNREETLFNLPDGLVMFEAGENEDAAEEFHRYIAENNYLVEMLTRVSPVHNWPTIPEIAEMDEYRNAPFIADNFLEEDLDIVSESFENGITFGTETMPEQANPYGASLLGTLEIGNMLYDVLVEGTPSSQAVDEYGQILRDELEEIRG